MKSAKTLSLRLLQRAFAQMQQPKFSASRRDFLKNAGRAAAVAAVSPAILPQFFASKTPRVAVVGAGLAGMAAAWHLQKNGIHASVFEASHRVGGRTFSVRDTFGTGTAVDLGGEFVDDWHEDLIALCREFQLKLYDYRTGTVSGEDTIFYGGRRIGAREIVEAMQPFCPAIQRDIARLPSPISYRNLAAVRDLDEVSIAQYLREKGIGGWLFDFLCNIFTSEYGMDAAEQSALNMLTVLRLPVASDEAAALIGGEGSEVMKIVGGTMSVCERIRERFTGELRLNAPLTRLEKLPDGAFRLGFDEGQTHEADAVVLALPFTKLREIDLQIPLSEPKRRAIAELGYGNSTKLVLGFKKNVWKKGGYSGSVSTDLPHAHGGWDATPDQNPPSGEAAWTLFTGGKYARELLAGDLKTNTKQCLAALDRLFPGAKRRHNHKSMLWPWEQYAWSRAGYSSWKVGQWQAFAGAEGEPEGRVFFAGEHCSVEFQGFMNGAAQTGRLAAEAILRL